MAQKLIIAFKECTLILINNMDSGMNTQLAIDTTTGII